MNDVVDALCFEGERYWSQSFIGGHSDISSDIAYVVVFGRKY